MSRRPQADRDVAEFILSLFGLVLCGYAALLVVAFGVPLYPTAFDSLIYPTACDGYRGAECAAAVVEGR